MIVTRDKCMTCIHGDKPMTESPCGECVIDASRPNYQNQNDPVKHPSHYTFGQFEVIDVIDDWGLDFCLANALKYIARAGRKDPSKTIEDLNKAIWYIEHEIERVKNGKNH